MTATGHHRAWPEALVKQIVIFPQQPSPEIQKGATLSSQISLVPERETQKGRLLAAQMPVSVSVIIVSADRGGTISPSPCLYRMKERFSHICAKNV
jgi:hypothetical protein